MGVFAEGVMSLILAGRQAKRSKGMLREVHWLYVRRMKRRNRFLLLLFFPKE